MSHFQKTLRNNLSIFLLTFSIFFAAGCGGSNSSDSANNISSQINGVVFDASIQGGNITAYKFDAGHKGDMIASSTTDTTGGFNLSINGYWGPIYLELQGGGFYDEASGAWVTLNTGDILSAVYNLDPGTQINPFSITPFTTIASGLAAWKISQGIPVSTAITDSNFEISNLLGVDIIKTKPLALTSGPALYSDQALYGLLIAAVSQTASQINSTNGWTGTSSAINSVRLSDIMRDDANDGILDGKQNVTPIQLGIYVLDSYNYRSKLCQAAALFLSSPQNKSGLGWNSFILRLTPIANNVTPLFPASDPPLPIDSSAPTLSLTSTYQPFSSYTITATASDNISGVASLILTPQSSLSLPIVQGNPGITSSVSMTVYLGQLPTGTSLFTATAEDWAGNITFSVISITK